MSALSNTCARLEREFSGAVKTRYEDGVLYLSGELGSWDEVVRAGHEAADAKKKRWSVVSDLTARGVEIPPMKTPSLHDDALEGRYFDAVVIGGGVSGCAIARELTKYDMSVLLCEKEHDVALQASSRNDGMIHPGIDLKPWQVKRGYNMRGNILYKGLCEQLGVEFSRPGQYLCMEQRYFSLIAPFAAAAFRARGLACEYKSGARTRKELPGLSKKVCCSLYFPSAGIVCPYGMTIALAECAAQNGAVISLDTAVTDMRVENGEIKAVVTNRGTVTPGVVINAAGVFCEEIAALAHDRFYSIHPRKGTNSILDKTAAQRFRGVVSMYSLKSKRAKNTKGGGVVLTADGNLLVGPDAQETYEKENFATSRESVDASFKRHGDTTDAANESAIITYFTGVRAATYEEDFVIEKGRRTRNLVHAAGIQSPGLTAAPAIAQDVAAMTAQLLGETRENKVGRNRFFKPMREPIPKIAKLTDEQRSEYIKRNPDYGEIVCRCEEISRGEIIDALHRSVPCDTVDGVKRRCRPGMGRCQGGFCGPLVCRIISQELNIPLEQVKKSGEGSELLLQATKIGEAGK